MKKVIAISSSGRKRNTYRLIESTRDLLEEAGIELEIIHLADVNIRDCRGCDACILTDKCPVKDEVTDLLNRMQEADGLILTSPVYMAGVSGQLKRLLDRTCRWYHRPALVGKPILLMTTTAGGYAKDVLTYLKKVSTFWGGNICGQVFRTMSNWDVGVSERELQTFIQAIHQQAKWKPQLNQVITFQVQKALAFYVLPRDKSYWQEHHWSEAVYYEGSQVAWYQKLIGYSFFQLLSHGMSHQKKTSKD